MPSSASSSTVVLLATVGVLAALVEIRERLLAAVWGVVLWGSVRGVDGRLSVQQRCRDGDWVRSCLVVLGCCRLGWRLFGPWEKGRVLDHTCVTVSRE